MRKITLAGKLVGCNLKENESSANDLVFWFDFRKTCISCLCSRIFGINDSFVLWISESILKRISRFLIHFKISCFFFNFWNERERYTGSRNLISVRERFNDMMESEFVRERFDWKSVQLLFSNSNNLIESYSIFPPCLSIWRITMSFVNDSFENQFSCSSKIWSRSESFTNYDMELTSVIFFYFENICSVVNDSFENRFSRSRTIRSKIDSVLQQFGLQVNFSLIMIFKLESVIC